MKLFITVDWGCTHFSDTGLRLWFQNEIVIKAMTSDGSRVQRCSITAHFDKKWTIKSCGPMPLSASQDEKGHINVNYR